MLIKQGFVNPDLKDYLQKLILDNVNFPWYYNNNQVDEDNSKSYPGLTHVFVEEKPNSVYAQDLINASVEILKQENIDSNKLEGFWVIRANLLLPLNEQFQEQDQIHTDQDDDSYLTILYYVDDSDGPTKFYDDNKSLVASVKPQAGKYIMFKSNTFHSGTLPKLNKKRCTLSIVIKFKEPL